ncbi:hypothetical protein [Bradyrhizobium japonicum]|nr:hypothetical protein [Bradyrhizobium japonicum]
MSRHELSAGLYAPIRVLMREDDDGGVALNMIDQHPFSTSLVAIIK